MLAKKNRLTKREDFSAVYSKGSFLSLDGISIKYAPSRNAETRIGFSVGKNFSKKAVERNRIKRLLRNAARTHVESLKPGFDIIVIPKPAQEKYEFAKIVTVFEHIFTKAKLLK